ncbi:MAG: choice-of-anchor J domain-containing protein [Prevotella sp.]|nr:choice-of-anchor J domain-containing protein [Prevotella sp.]MDY4667836.1 choice-of-anchor J domain-containing protein [Prevotella sp.]
MEKKLLHKTLFAGSLLLATVSLGANAQQADELTWQRTWYDAINLQWQPLTGDGSPVSVGIGSWKPAFTFPLNHSNAFTDGSSLYAGNNPFCRYDMAGNFKEKFSLGGVSDVWKATYDGKYFYMIEWEKKGIFVIDPESRKVVKVISTPDPGYLYYIRYVASLDGGKGGFVTGNYTSLFFIDMRGRTLGTSTDLSSVLGKSCVAQDVAVVDDKVYLLANNNTHSRKVYEFGLSDLKYTGKSFDLHDYVGQSGVEEAYYPRTLLSYSYPANRNYLMFVDYSGARFNATSVLVDSVASLQGLDGYNLYRDGMKLNSALLPPQTSTYADQDLVQGQTYSYSLRPVMNGTETEGKACSVMLSDTRGLPLIEDFSGYDHPNFVNMTRLDKNYFTITGVDSLPAWTISGYGASYMQYSHGSDTTFSQCLQSRPLLATAGDSVKIELDYTGNTYYSGLNTEKMNVEVQTDGTSEWTTVGSVSYVANYNSYTRVVFDATPYVAGKNFMVRLRPSGADAPTTKKYNWQIGNVKVWQYAPTTISGKLTLAGKPFSGRAAVKAVLKGIGDEYADTTDETGNFVFSDIHSGDYTLTVSKDQASYSTDVTLDDAGKQYVINVPAAVFTTQQSGIVARMGHNASKTITVALHNDGDTASVKYLSYRPKADGSAAQKGNSDIQAEEEWGVESNMKGNSNNIYNGVLYYQGKRYQKNTSYSSLILDELDGTGAVVGRDTLAYDDAEGPKATNFFACGSSLFAYSNANKWSTPAVPMYIMPVDLQAKKVLNSQKVAVDESISSVLGMTFNENDSSFYVSDYYHLYRLNRQGSIAETYDLPETSYRNLAFDNYSEGGPYVWMTKTNYSPVGYVLGKYSLKRQNFEKTFDVNSLSESDLNGASSGAYSPSNCSLQASTDVVPGYYSLIFSQNYSSRMGQNGSQTFVLRLFPIEKWLKLANDADTVKAQSDGKVMLTLSTESLKAGETKEATLVVSARNMAADVEIPVSLTLDEALDSDYPKAAPLTASATDENKVNVGWSTSASDHAIDHYSLYRNGELLAEGKNNSYTDETPLFGTQSYTVKSVFDDGVEVMSDTVDVKVNDPDWGYAVTELNATAQADTVSLNWIPANQYRHGLYDNFDNAEAFSIEPEEGWTFVDGDDSYSFSNTKIDYPNEGARMAAMYYKPALTTPRDSDLLDEGDNQMLTFTSSNVLQIKNNDWVMTPELDYAGPLEADFRLRTRHPSYGTEKLVVEYSLTGNESECFKPVADTLEVKSKTWTDYRVSLPAGTKYVALHYASKYTYNLFVDNFYVGQSGQYAPLTGFKLYRDGVAVDSLAESARDYTDRGVAEGQHTYIIETLYANGAKAQKAIDVTVGTPSGISSTATAGEVRYHDGLLTVQGGFDHLAVYAVSGSMVRQAGRHEADYTLTTSALPHGTYLIAVTKSGKTHTFKMTL